MVKYAPRKVYIRESGGYVELSYTEFCRCRESDQTYMDKLFIPIQGCAAMFVVGKSANGLTSWKNADGITLKDIESDETEQYDLR